MKTCKKILCLVLAMLLIFAVSACSDDDSDTKSKKDKDDTSSVENEGDVDSDDDEVKAKPVTVKDALNYEKDIVPTEESLQIGWDADGGKHKVRIPKITAKTKNAKKFNQRIYDDYKSIYQNLKNDTEGSDIYYCDYIYKIKNDIIGIVVTCDIGVQCGGISPGYICYYYDAGEDKELTYEEYLKALKLNPDKLQDRISNTKEYEEYDAELGEVLECILDKKGTVAFIKCEDSLEGWIMLTTEAII